MDPDLARKLSVMEVTNPVLNKGALPSADGINSHRMGPTSPNYLCGTCMNTMHDCPGHCGHIELTCPVASINYTSEVLKILKSVCMACARICISDDDPRLQGVRSMSKTARLAAVYAMTRAKKWCPHCGFPRPEYRCGSARVAREETEGMIQRMWPNGLVEAFSEDAGEVDPDDLRLAQAPFTPWVARDLLESISEHDADLLGVDHPHWLLLTVQVVPPPIIRPSVTCDNSKSRGQDDLTHMLNKILKLSQALKAEMEETGFAPFAADGLPAAEVPAAVQERIAALHCEVHALVNNSKGQSVQRSGNAHRSIKDRVSGKQGRVRENLNGKRVNFTARSVISPGAHHHPLEVGIPQAIATTLTIPETVNAQNIAMLHEAVARGHVVNGASEVVTSDGTRRLLSFMPESTRRGLRLKEGDVVHRAVRNGDPVILNRQPSLSMQSMMGHVVRVLPRGQKTITINLSMTGAYNADFDGDEMNVHVPQDAVSRNEIRVLMMGHEHVLGCKANRPVFGAVQDTLLGAYRLCSPDTTLDETTVAAMLYHVRHAPPGRTLGIPPSGAPPCSRTGRPRWTGNQMLSCLLPRHLCMRKGDFCVERGEITGGRANKAVLGASAGGLVHVIALDFGGMAAMHFLDDLQRMVGAYLDRTGFSVGISDCVLSEQGDQEIDERLAAAVQRINDIDAAIAKAPYALTEDEQEAGISDVLSRLFSQVGRVAMAHLPANNCLRIMAQAGSKGSAVNITQIVGGVGQQSIARRRLIPERGERSQPSSKVDDRSISAAGFVANPYVKGLEPAEFFFHAMGGREGLIDTAVKTSDVGYAQRRAMYFLQTFAITHGHQQPGMVCAPNGAVVEFRYGGDGLDPKALHKCSMDMLELSTCEIEQRAGPEAVRLVQRVREDVQRADVFGTLPDHAYLALSMERHLMMAPGVTGSDGAPLAASRDVRAVCMALCKQAQDQSGEDGSRLQRLHLLWHLWHARVPQPALRWIERRAAAVLRAATIAPGASVGCHAAQSVGEKLTQATLNQFHLAGVAENQGAITGMRLLKALMNASRMPNELICVVPAPGRSAAEVARRLPLVTVRSVTDHLLLIERHEATQAASLHWQVDAIMRGPLTDAYSSWVVRLALRRAVLEHAMLEPRHVARALEARSNGRARAVCSAANDDMWWVQVAIALDDAESSAGAERTRVHAAFNVLCTNNVLGGVEGVRRAREDERRVVHVSERDGSASTAKQASVCVVGGTLACVLSRSDVDADRTVSSDVMQVQDVLGIEAAHHVLHRRMMEVLAFDGSHIDPRHIGIMCNAMTRGGTVRAISRHGIDRTDEGTLHRAAFEETIKALSSAAVHEDTDPVRDTTSNIMFGNLVPTGTGMHYVEAGPEPIAGQEELRRQMTSQGAL